MTNPLSEWKKSYIRKVRRIIEKYNLKTPDEIVSFFMYNNISKVEPDFCPLFASKELCHDRKREEFCCLFCACPYYFAEYWNEDLNEYGRCTFGSVLGKYLPSGYWDCTNCSFVHSPEQAKRLYLKYPDYFTPKENSE